MGGTPPPDVTGGEGKGSGVITDVMSNPFEKVHVVQDENTKISISCSFFQDINPIFKIFKIRLNGSKN